MFEKIVSTVNNVVWSPALVILLVGAGLFFSIRSRFVQLRRIGLMTKLLTRKRGKDTHRRGVSSFEAFCIALAGRVGTGNIVGVATATALMILSTGTFNIFDIKTGETLLANAPELGSNYVGYTQAAVDSALGGFGGSFISIALSFFVFTTIVADYFYSESSIMYLCSAKKGSSSVLEKPLIWLLRLFVLVAVLFGSVKDADTVWTLGDIGLGMMAWINVVAIILLAPKAFAALEDYEKR